MSLFRIKGVVQHYAWGGINFIPELIGLSSTGEPHAEYWLGAHEKASSTIVETGETLSELIKNDPQAILGSKITNEFGRLPFLFKVLDVKEMLSIQVHPTKEEARKGFARENSEGIPLTAPHRNYKDDNHKPEMMVALSEFWLLHGFKPEATLRATLEATPELNSLVSIFDQDGYKGLYKSVMEESSEETNEVLLPLIKRLKPKHEAGLLTRDSADFWAVKAFDSFCSEGQMDKGIYSIYFFNLVKVNPGEAVFQNAGLPHAYLEGQNIELMANSDNVLRGGLTPKHIDVPELLKHIKFEPTVPNIMTGRLTGDTLERLYDSHVRDFKLSMLDITSASVYKSTSESLEILIITEGGAHLDASEQSISVGKGEAVVITQATPYQIKADRVKIFKAS